MKPIYGGTEEKHLCILLMVRAIVYGIVQLVQYVTFPVCLHVCCHPSLSIKCLLTIAKDCGRVDRTITDFSFFFGKSLTSFEFIALTWPGDTDYEFSENFQE